MKQIIILSVCLGFLLTAIPQKSFTQVPETINYQAVARDASGNLITNQLVSFRLTILQGGASGTMVYQETHAVTTNQFGVATLGIGNGIVTFGTFSTINWSLTTYWLRTELDPSGGTSYVIMGTSQFLSVPYALYSKSSGNSLPAGASGQTIRNDGDTWIPSSTLYNDGSAVGIGTTNPDNSALLDVRSTSKGFLPPRMTHSELDALTGPANGLVVFCSDCGQNGLGALSMFMFGQWYTLNANCLDPLAPASGTHVPSPTGVIWNWTAVPYATGYKWSTTNDYGTAYDMGAALTKTETGLTCNTPYTRFVWAYNACGASPSGMLNQTTSLDPPAAPASATHVPSPTQVVWNWSAVPNALGYKWNTSDDYGTATDMSTALTKTESGLSCNTSYTRYVWAYSNCGTSVSNTLTQTTSLDPPAAPASGTHLPTYTKIVWNWNSVPGATGYKWSTVSNYSIATDMGNTTTRTQAGLTCSNSYTSYVWAYGPCGYSDVTTLSQMTLTCFQCGLPLTDTTDYHVYSTVQIGTQCWMAQNLNAGAMINAGQSQTNNSLVEKYCYNNDENNCTIFGGLYQWTEMMKYVSTEGAQGCPAGWHIPSDAEWCTMTKYIESNVNCSDNGMAGSGTNCGGMMKETGTVHWASPNTGATNSSGFTALGTGYVVPGPPTGTSAALGLQEFFWTSTEYQIDAWNRYLSQDYGKIFRNIWDPKTIGFSCRCVKNGTN